MVFCSSNEEVSSVATFLSQKDVPALPLHGELNDSEKLQNMLNFRQKKFPVLVCSDAANRGVHFDFNPHIVQFSSPQNAIALLHRFGRTGRLGKKGVVTSFVTAADVPLLASFQELINNSLTIDAISSRKRSFSKKGLAEKVLETPKE